MLRTRPAALAAILLVTLPTLLVATPAALAEDFVPHASTVRYQTLPGFIHHLYVNFDDASPVGGSGQPNCNTGSLGSGHASPMNDGVSRNACAYPIDGGQATVPGSQPSSTRTFRTGALARSFNVTGNESVAYVHKLRSEPGTGAYPVPVGATLTANVLSGTRPVGTASYTFGVGDRGDDDGLWVLPIKFTDNANRATFDIGQPVTLELKVTSPATNVANPGAGSAAYTLDDTGTRLEIISQDAVRAAAWVGDPASPLPKTVFRPLPADAPIGQAPRIQLFYSVQSAFGYGDAASGGNPLFSIRKDGQSQIITSGGRVTREGSINTSIRVTEAGIATWTLPGDDALDYRGFAAGEYTLHVRKIHGQGSTISVGDTARFYVTSQGVTLKPYVEEGGRLGAETTGHDVIPGGSTTYLLLVNNSGSANDTFRIDASFVTGTPANGWSAVVSGPDVRQRTIDVPAGGQRLVTITISAPFAAAGASSVFRVTATSQLEPSVVSSVVTLATTISNANRREVAVLVPDTALLLDPGVPVDVPVYVWNRGTRPANATLELIEPSQEGWIIDLLNAGNPTQRVTLANVPAGGIAEATIRATGAATQVGLPYTITLNVTSLDAPGVAGERTLTFGLRTVGGVQVEILDKIGTHEHVVELTGSIITQGASGQLPDGAPAVPERDPNCASNPTSAYACFDDKANGAFFRVWVTNTGRVTDTFDLRLEILDYASVRGGCSTDAFARGGYGGASEFFRFYARSWSGRLTPLDFVKDLPPGQTAEVYLWRDLNGLANACNDDQTDNDFMSFLVSARGRATGSIGTDAAQVFAQNAGGDSMGERAQAGRIVQRALMPESVLMEPVKRTPLNPQDADAGPFLVDRSNLTLRTLVGSTTVNGTHTYFVRVTNGAGWGAYTDHNDVLQEPRVTVSAVGVDTEEGWNVSIRQVLDRADNAPTHGNASINFTNARDGRIEAWTDYELQVVVTAPSAANGTAVAGARDTFFLEARIGGKTSTVWITTVISPGAEIELSADTRNLPLHPGETGAALLTVKNVGGSEANATLRASIDPGAPNAAGWRVDPASLNFRVSALKNRTVALLVTPPAGTSPGTTTNVRVTVEYSPTSLGNETLVLPVTVFAAGTLDVSAPQTDATVAPGGYANFTLNVRNRGNLPVSFSLAASPLPEWDTSISQPSGILQPGETRSVAYVLRAPSGVEDNARFASVVRAEEIGNTANFDAQPLGINILGGKAAPFVSAQIQQMRVDRGGVQSFPIEVRNTGNAIGRIPIEVRASDPAWAVSVQNDRGENITGIRLNPNELAVLNVTVRPPRVVPERTIIPIEVTASTEDFTQTSKVTLRAEIHDYGLQLSLAPARLETPPGVATEFTLRVRNTGNDNDTLNLSAHFPDLPAWTVTLSTDRVTLEAGREAEVRATIRSPTGSLPTPRSYTFKFFAGTIGGAAVDLPRNDSVNAVVVILPYRSLDVDDDEQLELAVDADGRVGNGFESFREISSDGFESKVIANAPFDGKARFFLDVPRADRPLDGLADVWFDPEAVYAYEIEHAPDVNFDGTPEYLLDVDHDAKIDHAYDTVGDTYWKVTEVNVFGDARVHYLVDSSLDGRPDVLYDPEADRVSRTQTVSGQPNTIVGLDTDDDGKVDKLYDTRTKTLQDYTVAKASGFLADYWWFFGLFALMVLTTIILLVARRRRHED